MTTVAATTATTTSSSASSVMSSLTSSFDTFLTLLTTELQNQDPTNPMDSSEFTSQIAQFCQVEAQMETNDKLDTLISQGSSSAAGYTVDYLGKTVTLSDGTGVLSDGSATWTYDLGATAASTTLTVTDSSGNTVYTASGDTASGSHEFDWDGVNASGTQLADGAYTLTVSAKTADGNTVSTTTTSSGKVTGVDMSGSTAQLIIGSTSIALSDVSAVNE
jgi:flagellar basal-body rod modification protein FlgD